MTFKHIVAHTRLAVTDAEGVLRASEEGEQLEVGKHVTEDEAKQFVADGLAAGVKADSTGGKKQGKQRAPRKPAQPKQVVPPVVPAPDAE